jgi:hypothetical protein
MSERSGWFAVDKVGLSKLLRRKGLAFILYELVQNAWDTDTPDVSVELTPVPGAPLVRLRVEDKDPTGFDDLTHAYTLFAESNKKGDPKKRGRFNLGEKLVLSACEGARISSTTGTVYFEREGTELIRRTTRERQTGSSFEARIRMTRSELTEILDASALLIPPIPTYINGIELPSREPIHTFEATLPTEISDEEGYLRRTSRKTSIRVYKTPADGSNRIYELGIPVVTTDLPWTVEVMQKVPLNSDRDNITPAYQRELTVLVLNEMHDKLDPEHAALPVVLEALESERITGPAVTTILTHQFGEKRTIFDPSDPESNSNAFAHGCNVIAGGTFNRAQWASIKRTNAAMPSGKLYPTPKTYNPEGAMARTIPESEWTTGMKQTATYIKELVRRVLEIEIRVIMENEITQPYSANYGSQRLTFNAPRLGFEWFDLGKNSVEINDLLIHELGHEFEGNHLSGKYHQALTRIGSKIVELAITDPAFFRYHGVGAG